MAVATACASGSPTATVSTPADGTPTDRAPTVAASTAPPVTTPSSTLTEAPSSRPPSSEAPEAPSNPSTASETSGPSGDRPTAAAPSTVRPVVGGLPLPAPEGPDAVGAADLPLPGVVAFYPARAGTGHGPWRYIDPAARAAIGFPAGEVQRVETAAEAGAAPADAVAPRPVVVIAPGFRSVVALSTVLAQDLASEGYVVVAAQTDVATEVTHAAPTASDRSKRTAQVEAVLDLLQQPAVAQVVGPIDLRRIAVGGHSYAGSIAFNASLVDRRIAAVFDLDGSVFGSAATTPTKVPSLVVSTPGGTEADPHLVTLASRSPHTVAVGLLRALHFDVTDAPCIVPALGDTPPASLVGTIGSRGSTDTATIVRRFLDAALGPSPRLATASELVAGLPGATADPFGHGP